MDNLYKKIRKRRLGLGMTQEELANLVGYNSRSMINRIEAGKQDLTRIQIIQFAEALDTTPAWLLDIEPEDKELDKLQNIINERPEIKTLIKLSLNLNKENINFVIKILKSMRK